MRYAFLGAFVLFLVSENLPAQQPVSTQSGPPLERHILSLDEAGQHQLDIVYHGNNTCDMLVDRTLRWHCSWSIRQSDGAFCFTQDGGKDAGRTTCKQGRLIGRASFDGTPLANAEGATCTDHDRGGREWCARTYAGQNSNLNQCLFEVKGRLDRCMQTGEYVTNHGTFNVIKQ